MPPASKRQRVDPAARRAVRGVEQQVLFEVSRATLQYARAACLFDASLESLCNTTTTTATPATPKGPLKALYIPPSPVGADTLAAIAGFLAKVAGPAAEGGATATPPPAPTVLHCAHPDAEIVRKGALVAAAIANGGAEAPTTAFTQCGIPGVACPSSAAGEAPSGADAAGIAAGSYDIVITVDTLHGGKGAQGAEDLIAFCASRLRPGGTLALLAWGKGSFKRVFSACHDALSRKGVRADPASLDAGRFQPTAKELGALLEGSGLSPVVPLQKFAGGCVISPPIAPWLVELYAPCIRQFEEDVAWRDAFAGAVAESIKASGMLTADGDWELDGKTMVCIARKGCAATSGAGDGGAGPSAASPASPPEAAP